MVAKPGALERFAQRLRQQPAFMAYVLQRIMTYEHMDEERLARQLGVDALGLTRLALCKRPRPDPEHFNADVQAIADYTGANMTELLRLLRTMDTLEAFQEVPTPQPTPEPDEEAVTPSPTLRAGLVAARDRAEEEEEYRAGGEAPEEAPTEPPPDTQAEP